MRKDVSEYFEKQLRLAWEASNPGRAISNRAKSGTSAGVAINPGDPSRILNVSGSGSESGSGFSSAQALLVMPDQLNLNLLRGEVRKNRTPLIFIESYARSSRLPFHKKRLIYEFSAQRHFAVECAEAGHPVLYLAGEETAASHTKRLLDGYSNICITWIQPADRDTRKELEPVQAVFPGRTRILPNPFFMADPREWTARIREGYRMEFFYREMRKMTGYLMDGGKPEGGEWNYDKMNRESLPEGHPEPEIPGFDPDNITAEVTAMVESRFSHHFGSSEGFDLAVTREQALLLADRFFTERLNGFGPYEDAMASGKPTLFHSVLSVYMNNGLLLPGELCDRAEAEYRKGNAPLNSVEGYIRQIIGWREYIRVYYEAMMPEVREANAFGFKNRLPQFFWDGETKMKCVTEAVQQVIRTGYSHHIQRLMVLSNISNLTETNPHDLFEWFWFAYIDAWEWVVLPNVLGMSTFADGGVLASKPYVSGGNYINKMSDYCSGCSYSISKKEGEDACPFNYLYWNFVNRQREAFSESGRVSFMVNTYDKFDPAKKAAITKSSNSFIDGLKRYAADF
jgi:deoxyribodipyrimidine photolyase-related protein